MRYLLTALVLLAMGCNPFDPSGGAEEPGRLGKLAIDPVLGNVPILAPDTVSVGVPFDVRVVTQYEGCGARVARTEVRATADSREIRPYNLPPPEPQCVNVWAAPIVHDVTVTATRTGTLTIRAYGRLSDDPDVRGEETAAHRVVVR